MHYKQFCIKHLVHLPLRLDSCSMRSLCLLVYLLQQDRQLSLLTCLLLQQVSQVSLLTGLFALIGQIGDFACLFIYLLSQGSCSLSVGWQVKEVCFCHLLIMLSSLLLLIVKLACFTQNFHFLSQELSINPWPKSTQVTQLQVAQQGLLIRQVCLSRLALYSYFSQLVYSPTNLLPLAYIFLQL